MGHTTRAGPFTGRANNKLMAWMVLPMPISSAKMPPLTLLSSCWHIQASPSFWKGSMGTAMSWKSLKLKFLKMKDNMTWLDIERWNGSGYRSILWIMCGVVWGIRHVRVQGPLALAPLVGSWCTHQQSRWSTLQQRWHLQGAAAWVALISDVLLLLSLLFLSSMLIYLKLGRRQFSAETQKVTMSQQASTELGRNTVPHLESLTSCIPEFVAGTSIADRSLPSLLALAIRPSLRISYKPSYKQHRLVPTCSTVKVSFRKNFEQIFIPWTSNINMFNDLQHGSLHLPETCSFRVVQGFVSVDLLAQVLLLEKKRQRWILSNWFKL